MEITRDQLWALEERRLQAMLRGDLEMLTSLLHPELVYTHSTGVVDGRDTFLHKIQDGSLKYVAINTDDTRVVIVPGSAIAHYRLSMNVDVGGVRRFVRSRAISVWVAGDEGPHMVAFHSTPTA